MKRCYKLKRKVSKKISKRNFQKIINFPSALKTLFLWKNWWAVWLRFLIDVLKVNFATLDLTSNDFDPTPTRKSRNHCHKAKEENFHNRMHPKKRNRHHKGNICANFFLFFLSSAKFIIPPLKLCRNRNFHKIPAKKY